MKRLKNLLLLIILSLSTLVYSQSEKNYDSGEVYWGAFDIDKQDIVGEMTKYADVIQLKRVDYDYYVYAKDTNGKNFRSKFSKINNEPKVNNKYIDENGTEYLIDERGNNLFILCLKPLPNVENKFMILKITNIY